MHKGPHTLYIMGMKVAAVGRHDVVLCGVRGRAQFIQERGYVAINDGGASLVLQNKV